MTVNIYVPNVSALNIIKQALLDIKGQIGLNKITVHDFTIALLRIAHTDLLPKINKKQSVKLLCIK
jgi:hypothetical protein